MLHWGQVMLYEIHFDYRGRAGHSGAAAGLPGGCRLSDRRDRGRGGGPGAVRRAALRPGAAGPDAPKDRRLRGLRVHPPPVPGAHSHAHRPGRGRIAAPGLRHGHRRLCDQALLHASATGKDSGHPPPPGERRGGQPPALPGPDFGPGQPGGGAGGPVPGPDRPGV